MCRHHGGTEWYDRAEDDVLQEQSDGAPSGGVGEHAVGSSGGRGGAERGERTGDMCGFVWADAAPSGQMICNASFVWADVTAKMDSPPLVDFSPVTGPHPLNHPLGGP